MENSMENDSVLEQIETLIQRQRESLDEMEQLAHSHHFDCTEEAYTNYQRALEARKRLADYSRVLESDLAESYKNLGNYFGMKKKYADSEACYENSLQICRGLFIQDPKSYCSNLVSIYKKLVWSYDHDNLYAKLGQLQKHILDAWRHAPDFAKKEIEDALNDCRQHLSGHEERYLELPADVPLNAGTAYGCMKKGEAYLAKGENAAAEPYLWKAIELYEDLSRKEAGNYDAELLDLYQKMSTLQNRLFPLQKTLFPFSLAYAADKFITLYKKVSVVSKAAADSCMASFCKELLRKDSELFKTSTIGYEVYEEILKFITQKDKSAPDMLIGRLYCRMSQQYLDTSYGKDCAENMEKALMKAIHIFEDYMEKENPSDFSYLLNAYELLAKLYRQQKDEKKAAETLRTVKRIIEEKMEKDKPAFAPYLAKYYYHIGFDLADGTGACAEPFAAANSLFTSFLDSDSYTDAEKEDFKSYLKSMQTIIEDIYQVYGTYI